MIKLMKEQGAALVEAAVVIPLLTMLIIGGVILGLASVEMARIERLASDAAILDEDDANKLVSGGGGTLLCWWRGSGEGGCFDDGLTTDRTQVIARGRTWIYPTGKVTPRSSVTRPIATTTTTESMES